MTALTRALAPAVLLIAAALAAGCSGSGSHSSPGSTAAASTAAASTGTAAASAAAAPSAVAVSGTVSAGASAGVVPSVTSPVASASAPTGPTGADVYFAESQDANGTTVHEPACGAGCPLSGDGTTVLWNMTWPTWNGTEAVGTGTERIESCNPNCASGGQYSVKVTVTFTQPVRDCADGLWFWTHASFDWPDGLPSALRGDNAPINPWDFTQLRAQATQSCG
jgi:hypothetical protein